VSDDVVVDPHTPRPIVDFDRCSRSILHCRPICDGLCLVADRSHGDNFPSHGRFHVRYVFVLY